jgi:hypothetical protein
MSQQTMDCSGARLSLGVYVLGAIDPAERTLVDGHLATCRDCRDELAGLAGIPALLARVGTEEAIALAADEPAPLGLLPDVVDTGLPDVPAERTVPLRRLEQTAAPGAAGEEPPRELLGAVLDLTAARRRRRNWRNVTLTAAAAVVIAAGAFGGARLASGTPQPAGSALNYGPGGNWQSAAGSTQGMGATVMFRQMGWGTQLAAKVVGIPLNTNCQLWVVRPDGSRELAGSWVTDSNEGVIWYSGGTSTPMPDVHEFMVTIAGHQSITVHAS